MKTIFGNTADARDPKYIDIRSGRAPGARELVESLWGRYYLYADSNFLEQIRIDFDARFWEMNLACTLMDKGYEVTKKTRQNAGPDIRIAYKGKTIWIEAVAPTGGSPGSNDRVPELEITNPPTAQRVPDEQIVLRYCAAIREKYNNKYIEYLKRGIVSEEDCYVIAINGCRIPHSSVEIDLPRIVRSVLPLGYPVVKIDTVSGQRTNSYQYRPKVTKASGCTIETDIFLDYSYRHISAVIFSNADVFYNDDFITVHNPLTCKPLPDDFPSIGPEWKAELKFRVPE